MERLIENLTLLESPFGTINEAELKKASEFISYFDMWTLINEIFDLGVIIGSVFATVLMIYVILKFEYLKTRVNMYLLHYSIAYLIFFASSPILDIIWSYGLYEYVSYTVICPFFRISEFAIQMVIVFGTLFGIDWVVVAYLNSWLDKYEKIQKYIIATIYIVNIIYYSMTVISCFGVRSILSNDYLILIIIIMLVTAIVINCFTYFKKPKKEFLKFRYILTISNIVVSSWLPLLCIYFFLLFVAFNYAITLVILAISLEHMLRLLLLGMPIIVAYNIRILDNNFQKAYNVVFTKPPKNYTQENLDDDDDDNEHFVNENQGNIIQV